MLARTTAPASRSRRRARTLVALLAALALLPLGAPPAVAAEAVRPTGPLVPHTGTLFGAFVNYDNLHTMDGVKSMYERREAQMGRKFDLAHHFYAWDKAWPTDRERLHVQSGRIPYVSWAAPNVGEINRGVHDAWIAQRADAARAFGQPLFLRWFWEMDAAANQDRAVSPEAFKAAWRHIHRIFQERNATQVIFVWCGTAYGFQSGDAQQWYPGDDVVDWVSADGYNWAPGRPTADWRSFSEIHQAFYDWGMRRRKPMIVGEYGALEREPGERARWLRDARQALKTEFPGIAAVTYFDSHKDDGAEGWFDWRVHTSTDTLSAFVDMARDPYFRPSEVLVPATAPTSPVAQGVVRGDLTATVSWTRPAADGGSPIAGYRIRSLPGGHEVTARADATSATVTGLTVGTVYSFTVEAFNVAGYSAPSAAPNTIVAATVPSAPTMTGVSRGDRSMTVTWEPPADTGGAAITGYVVRSTDSEVSTQVGALATSATVSGLVPGVGYRFVVEARNAIGGGPASAASAWTAAVTVPGAPAIGTATRGTLSATVSWDAPTDNGGSSITGYRVLGGPQPVEEEGGRRSAVVVGLTRGVDYTFRVVAVNSVGDSAASSASNVITAAGPAAAPATPYVERGDRSVTVRWTTPASDGGAEITGYRITGWGAPTVNVGPAARSATVTGLTNGKSYRFKVAALNDVEVGPWSSESDAVVPATVPGAPGIGTATRGNLSATVNWGAPASTGGIPVTAYRVLGGPEPVQVEAWKRSAVVTGLTLGSSQTFRVVAVNGVGDGAASAPSNVITAATTPSAPAAPAVQRGDRSVTVRWSAPDTDGGNAITGYRVTAFGAPTVEVGPAARSVTVTGLTNGKTYRFKVAAHNGIGASFWSAEAQRAVPATVPGAPGIGSATRGNLSATVTWTAPSSNGGTPVTGYRIVGGPQVVMANDSARKALVTGLTRGTSYTFRVLATNDVGEGVASAASNTIVAATAPGAPVIVAVTPGPLSASLRWTAPDSDGGAAITGYRITAFGAPTVDVGASARSVTVTGLTQGKYYRFKVTAINPVGATQSAQSPAVVPTG